MTRALYQLLLWLHPASFRREFAGEMLWIFESSVDSEGASALLVDALSSLARQWFLRSGFWRIAAALTGAVLQFAVGWVGVHLLAQRQIGSWVGAGALARAQSHSVRFAPGVSDLVCATICLIPGVIIAVLLLGVWTRRFTNRRIASLATGPAFHRRPLAR